MLVASISFQAGSWPSQDTLTCSFHSQVMLSNINVIYLIIVRKWQAISFQAGSWPSQDMATASYLKRVSVSETRTFRCGDSCISGVRTEGQRTFINAGGAGRGADLACPGPAPMMNLFIVMLASSSKIPSGPLFLYLAIF